jgi:hypothetical protein
MKHFVTYIIIAFVAVACGQHSDDPNTPTKIKSKKGGDPSESYEGGMVDGKRNGIGKLNSQFGVYEGEFKNDSISGFGKFIGRDGSFYVGDWQNRKWHGIGEARWPAGNYCVCEFEQHKIKGFGHYIRTDSSQYDGYYLNGVKHGKGKAIIMNKSRYGHIYLGEFNDGKIHGFGKYYFPDGTSESGIFVDNKLTEPKEFTVNDSLEIENMIRTERSRMDQYLRAAVSRQGL